MYKKINGTYNCQCGGGVNYHAYQGKQYCIIFESPYYDFDSTGEIDDSREGEYHKFIIEKIIHNDVNFDDSEHPYDQNKRHYKKVTFDPLFYRHIEIDPKDDCVVYTQYNASKDDIRLFRIVLVMSRTFMEKYVVPRTYHFRSGIGYVYGKILRFGYVQNQTKYTLAQIKQHPGASGAKVFDVQWNIEDEYNLDPEEKKEKYVFTAVEQVNLDDVRHNKIKTYFAKNMTGREYHPLKKTQTCENVIKIIAEFKKGEYASTTRVVMEKLGPVFENWILYDKNAIDENNFRLKYIGKKPYPALNVHLNRKILGYIIQACKALECVHDNGIFHGDVKTSNFGTNDQSILKLFDFGESQFRPNELNKRGAYPNLTYAQNDVLALGKMICNWLLKAYVMRPGYHYRKVYSGNLDQKGYDTFLDTYFSHNLTLINILRKVFNISAGPISARDIGRLFSDLK